jgi:hypothetical protein
MDPKGKRMVVNDKKESLFNEPRDGKPTDSGSSHTKRDGKKKRHQEDHLLRQRRLLFFTKRRRRR